MTFAPSSKIDFITIHKKKIMKFRVISNNEDETKQIAKAIAPFFNIGDLILLDGSLAAGKTYFVKGFAEGKGSNDLVTSPTFSLANFYNCESLQILHMDLYRISTIDEFSDLGLMEYFPQTIALIEWGKKFIEYFDEYLLITFEYFENDKDIREITFSCKGDRYTEIINLFNQKLPNLLSC